MEDDQPPLLLVLITNSLTLVSVILIGAATAVKVCHRLKISRAGLSCHDPRDLEQAIALVSSTRSHLQVVESAITTPSIRPDPPPASTAGLEVDNSKAPFKRIASA
jgi:hypothetical protein